MGGVIFLINILIFNHIQSSSILLLVPLISRTCWYYSAYILLMILAPFINKGIEQINLRLYRKLLVLLLLICYIGNFIFHRDGTTFDLLLFIYFLGRYINKANINPKASTSFLLFLTVSTLMVVVNIIAYQLLGEKALHILFNNHNPLIILNSICLFFTLKNAKEKNFFTKKLSRIAPYTFAVYIIHVSLLYVKIIPFDSMRFSNPYTSVLFISLILLIICSLAEILRSKLTSKIENKLYKFISSSIRI